MRLRELATAELTKAEVTAIRTLMDLAFWSDDEDERFTEDDWMHAIGGTHFVLDDDGTIVTHASVVERELHVDGVPFRTGYVEAVATAPGRENQGHGSTVLEAVGTYIRGSFELGGLGTGRHRFYERLGWETWTGPAFVRLAGGPVRTPEEEGYILILRTASTPPLDLGSELSCEWRPGDVW